MNKLVRYILLFYIVVLPWLAMINRFFANGRVLNLVRELSILLLLIPLFLGFKNVKGKHLIPFFFGALIIIYLSLYTLIVPTQASFFGFRLYGWPILVYMAIIAYPMTNDEVRKYLKAFLISAVVACGFSLFQQIVLGEEFLLAGDYPRDPEIPNKLTFVYYIAFGLFQRGTGGFVTPIPFSIFTAVSVIILTGLKAFGPPLIKRRNLILFVLWIALILTFTRSTIMFTIASVFLYDISFKSIVKIFWVVVFAVLAGYIALSFLDEDLAIVSTLYSFAENLYNLDDSSAVGHFDSLIEGMEWTSRNIYHGYGLGLIGPHTESYGDVNIVIESMLLSIVVENGLLFFLLYCGFMLGILISSGWRPLIVQIFFMYFAVGVFLPIGYYIDMNIIVFMLLALIVQYQKTDGQEQLTIPR